MSAADGTRSNGSDAIDVVRTFCREFSAGPTGLRDAVRRWFTARTVWVNTGLATTTGIDEAIALIDGLELSAGIAAVEIDITAIAADMSSGGAKVLTERFDHMLDAAGGRIRSDPVMGIFEIADGRIAAWRDYFDSAAAVVPPS